MKQRLSDPLFADSVLITQYSMAVFYFAQARAIRFARSRNASAFWIQAADSPPTWFCNQYDAAGLEAQKKKWLSYHGRKTEGVLSLLLCCFDMPFKVTHSGGPEYKKYGIHNGARCRLKAWELEAEDTEALRESCEQEIVLTAMPKIL